MLDNSQGGDFAIWLVALLLYVCDAAKLLSPRELLLVEAGEKRLAAGFSESPFTIAGRVLVFAPLLLPHRGVFVAPWGKPWSSEAQLNATLESLHHLRESLLPARALAVCAFVLLFLLGPALTVALGPNAAVFYTAAALYPTALAAIATLWWKRRDFRLTAGQSAWLSVELLICPAFLPNLVRKITVPRPIEADGAQVLVAVGSDEVGDAFFTRLESRAEALIEEEGADPALEEELRAYLGTVRAAR